jgi:hypothetical protein
MTLRQKSRDRFAGLSVEQGEAGFRARRGPHQQPIARRMDLCRHATWQVEHACRAAGWIEAEKAVPSGVGYPVTIGSSSHIQHGAEFVRTGAPPAAPAGQGAGGPVNAQFLPVRNKPPAVRTHVERRDRTQRSLVGLLQYDPAYFHEDVLEPIDPSRPIRAGAGSGSNDECCGSRTGVPRTFQLADVGAAPQAQPADQASMSAGPPAEVSHPSPGGRTA